MSRYIQSEAVFNYEQVYTIRSCV